MSSVPSVQVGEMDAEHASCEDAMRQLCSKQTAAALEAVLEEFEEHFAHEEQMLDQYLYAGEKENSSGGFSVDASARKSHFADHARMLATIRAELGKARGPNCLVPGDFVRKVVSDFEAHATKYDANYAERMAQQLAAASTEAEASCSLA